MDTKDFETMEKFEYILKERIKFISKYHEVIKLILMESQINPEIADFNFINQITLLLKDLIKEAGIDLKNEGICIRLLMGSILSFLYLPEVNDEEINNYVEKLKDIIIETFKKPWIRYGILVLFLGTMIMVFKTGKKLPVLPGLFGLGIIITIFYKPEFWHKYLCPYGTLLSIFSKFNKRSYMVVNEDCIKCGKCVRVCPSDAILWEDKKEYPIIMNNECLLCGKCKEVCPTDTIK